jgi:hypothetical protein
MRLLSDGSRFRAEPQKLSGSTIQPQQKQKMKTKNMTTLHLEKSINRSPLRRGFVLIALALACFTLSQMAQAVTPAPDGGYTGANTAEGTNALFSLTSGVWNTALGYQALYHVTTGNQNTATGYQTLFSNTTGNLSVANGSQALFNNTSGNYNTATGFRTLYANTTGSSNTGNGFEALNFNTTGVDNTANGFKALYNNTTGGDNVAVGFQALYKNSTGSDNNAVGVNALNANTSGFYNNAHGRLALQANDGDQNNALGDEALYSNVSGSFNTGIGDDALFNCNSDSNVGVGDEAGNSIIDGTGNVAVGAGTGTGIVHASNVIAIGNVTGVSSSFGDASDTCYIGSIFNEPVGVSGTAQDVYVDQDGVLGFLPSSRRFKHDIKPMDNASEALLALKPVTFKYNSDKKGAPQFGLIAEDVAEVNPDLVLRNKKGEITTVRYEQINAMLLNEFLKEHKKVQNLETTVAQQQKGMEVLTAQLKQQAAQIQKVSAQLELRKPAPRTVLNNQ